MAELRRVGEYRGPDLVVHPESEPFWRGLGEGQLRLQRCGGCAQVRFPIAPVCWRCATLQHDWVPVAGDGVVSAAVVVHRATGNQRWAGEVPFVSAQVDLSGGLRVPGRILPDPDAPTAGSDVATPGSPDAPAHGTPVQAAYLAAPGGYGVLCFVERRPA